MKKRERDEKGKKEGNTKKTQERTTKKSNAVKKSSEEGEKKPQQLVMNCAVTGYMHGDYLKGNAGRAEGGVIRVWFGEDGANVDVPKDRRAQAEGRYVAPIRMRCEQYLEDHADAFLDKLRAFPLFRDAADTRGRLKEVWFAGKNHDSIGCGFGGVVLLEVLVLPKRIKELFEEQPDEEKLERIMTQKLTAEELLELLPRKSTSSKSSMVLHASEWSVATWKSFSHVDDPLCVVSLEHGTVEQARPGERCSPQHELWEVSGLAESWKSKKSNTGARRMERVSTQTVMFRSPHMNQRLEKADTLRCLTMLDIPHSQEDVVRLQGSLQGICTAGLCKSLMQKLLRFQPMQCDLGGGGVFVSAEVALVHVMCALYNSAGQFNPDIQRWISGVESLCKRLGVILFEDSTYTDPRDSVRLLGAAVLSQHVPVWRPSEALFLQWLRVAVEALRKRDAYVYDSKFAGQNFVVRSDAHPFQVASALLDECGSFAGDENMARHIASREGKDQVRAKAQRPLTMPFPEHALDQHTCPSMVYLFPPALVNEWATSADVQQASAPFAPVMAQLFQSVTGFNPRRTKVDWTLFEVESVDIRSAQRDMLRWLRRKGTLCENRLVLVDRVAVKLEPLSDEWIAGMVGQVEQDRYYGICGAFFSL